MTLDPSRLRNSIFSLLLSLSDLNDGIVSIRARDAGSTPELSLIFFGLQIFCISQRFYVQGPTGCLGGHNWAAYRSDSYFGYERVSALSIVFCVEGSGSALIMTLATMRFVYEAFCIGYLGTATPKCGVKIASDRVIS